MKCPKCPHENPNDAMFCGMCGSPMDILKAVQQGLVSLEVFPLGETINGRIASKGGKTLFGFKGEVGDMMVARLVDCSSQGGQPVRWEPTIEIRDPNGVLIGRMCKLLECRLRGAPLETSGMFSIAFGDSGQFDQFSGSVSFGAFLQKMNRSVRAKMIEPGKTLQTYINCCGGVDTYMFEAQAGGRMRLEVVQHTMEGIFPYVEIFDPEGNLLDMVKQWEYTGKKLAEPAVIEKTIENSGLYTLLVSSNDQKRTGPYRIRMNLTYE